MPAFDIVVVGGGPAGLQFAREVGSRSSHAIVVLERNAELADNDKSTGGTFEQVVDGYDVPDRVVMAASPDVTFEGPDASATLDLPNYVLDFPAFVDFLGEDAASEGVEIHTSTRVAEPIVEGGRVVGVRAHRSGSLEEYRADVVVDASGPTGALTSDLGMWDPDAAQHGIGKEYEVEGRFDRDSMLFTFDHEFAPGGYAWTFPGGDGVFKIGVCWVNDFHERHRETTARGIDSYIDAWVESDDRWTVEEVRAIHAGTAVVDNSINQRADDGIVAVGDAVSSINPLFGEGIRPGMESAEMAADVVIEALRDGNTSRAALSAYETRWNREKGSNWKTQRMVGELLYDFDADQQNRFVRNAGDLTAEQTGRLQRYESTLGDLLGLYPFKRKDVSKVPTLLRHLR